LICSVPDALRWSSNGRPAAGFLPDAEEAVVESSSSEDEGDEGEDRAKQVRGQQELGLPGLQLLGRRHGRDSLPDEQRVGAAHAGAPASAPAPSRAGRTRARARRTPPTAPPEPCWPAVVAPAAGPSPHCPPWAATAGAGNRTRRGYVGAPPGPGTSTAS
jgi:hypothetical protein